MEIRNQMFRELHIHANVIYELYNALPNSNEKYQNEVDGAIDVKFITKEGLVIQGIQWVPETNIVYWGLSAYQLY